VQASRRTQLRAPGATLGSRAAAVSRRRSRKRFENAAHVGELVGSPAEATRQSRKHGGASPKVARVYRTPQHFAAPRPLGHDTLAPKTRVERTRFLQHLQRDGPNRNVLAQPWLRDPEPSR
jgi:hypothetical protein